MFSYERNYLSVLVKERKTVIWSPKNVTDTLKECSSRFEANYLLLNSFKTNSLSVHIYSRSKKLSDNTPLASESGVSIFRRYTM